MLYLVVTSLLLYALALCWALVLLRRLRDWRLSFLIAALALVVLLDAATLVVSLPTVAGPLTSEALFVRLGMLTVALLVLLSVYALGAMVGERERLAQLADQHRAHYRRLVDNIGVIAWEADAVTKRFTFVSQRAEAILGYPVQRWYDAGFWEDHLHPEDRERTVSFCEEASARGEPYEFEYRMVRPDGSVVWLHDVVSVTMRDGKPWRIHGALIDITQRKHTEEKLRESDERYRQLFARHPQPMWVYDTQSLHFLEVNQAAIRHYGFTREEFLAMTIHDIRLPEDVPLLDAVLVDPGLKHAHPHWRHRTKNGSIIDVKVDSHPVTFDGHPAQLVVATDITEHNEVERQRQRLEAEREQLLGRLRLQFQHMPVGCILVDADGTITDWNPAAERIFGWLRSEALGRSLIELVVPLTLHDEIRQLFNQVAASPQSVHHTNENITRDGRMITCEWHNMPVPDQHGRTTGVLCSVQDATERINAEEALRRSEARLQRIFNGNIMGIVSWTRDGRIAQANDIFLHMVGYTREDVAAGNLRWPDLTPSEHRWLFQRAMEEINAGGVCVPFENEFIRKDGKRLPVLMGGATLEGEPDIGVAFTVDISALRQARQLFRQSEERYRRLAEHGAMGIWEVTRDGRTVYANPAMCRMLEVDSLDELRGIDYHRFFSPESRFILEQEQSRRVRGEHSSNEVELVGARGGRRHVMIAGAPVVSPGQELETFLGTFTDITDLKRTEEVLRQSQKMDAVGQLASGVAHDFNNLITAIFGYTSLARRTLSSEHPATRALDRVDAAARHAAGVTRGLLTFSREGAFEKKTLRLGRNVIEAVDLVRRMLPANIKLCVEADAVEDDWIVADATQIQQVVMNLAINARDAMPQGGQLRIAITAPQAEHGLNGDSRQFLALVVSDTGHGMSPDVQARIFEPFFTTKPPGRGTGLGLPIIHGIVKDHGGSIKVDSGPDAGSTFTVLLPRAPAPPLEERGEGPDVPVKGRGQLVLLAEARTYVREIIASMLQSLGYEVVQCPDHDALQAACEQAGQRAGLVILDCDAACNNGEEETSAVQAEHAPQAGGAGHILPDSHRRGGRRLPTLLMVSNLDGVKDDPQTRTFHLQKPFQMGELAAAVALALAEPKEPLDDDPDPDCPPRR